MPVATPHGIAIRELVQSITGFGRSARTLLAGASGASLATGPRRKAEKPVRFA